jgi:hypothetical protein
MAHPGAAGFGERGTRARNGLSWAGEVWGVESAIASQRQDPNLELGMKKARREEPGANP